MQSIKRIHLALSSLPDCVSRTSLYPAAAFECFHKTPILYISATTYECKYIYTMICEISQI